MSSLLAWLGVAWHGVAWHGLAGLGLACVLSRVGLAGLGLASRWLGVCLGSAWLSLASLWLGAWVGSASVFDRRYAATVWTSKTGLVVFVLFCSFQFPGTCISRHVYVAHTSLPPPLPRIYSVCSTLNCLVPGFNSPELGKQDERHKKGPLAVCLN